MGLKVIWNAYALHVFASSNAKNCIVTSFLTKVKADKLVLGANWRFFASIASTYVLIVVWSKKNLGLYAYHICMVAQNH